MHRRYDLSLDRHVCCNHPNDSAASLTDLDAAAWLDAERLIVVNPDGTQHHYARQGDKMIPLDPIHNPDYVAPADPVETLAADLAYQMQTLREIGNPPERVMEQGEPLWWQEENIIVPYHTDETIEEVALRMVGPPPDLVRDQKYYDELLEEHLNEITDFTLYLRKLNEGNTQAKHYIFQCRDGLVATYILPADHVLSALTLAGAPS